MMKKPCRNQLGNTLGLVVCVIAAIVIPVMILLTLVPGLIYGGRAKNVVEAAGLLAANDLSRIVIDDPDFGYVSLSNYAPLGNGTRARDGQPLPVTGINTLIGTMRQNAIIAEELRNESMQALVDEDMDNLDGTISNLGDKLEDALSDRTRGGKCFDMHGKPVKPVENVEAFLRKNLPPNVELQSVTLSLGWLDGGSESTIAVPQPAKRFAHVPPAEEQDGKYRAFTNYPVGKREFSFAGLDSRAHLVSADNFREDDGKHICSIVKIECTLKLKDNGNGGGESSNAPFVCVACCQPYSQPDAAMRGAMTVRFSGRPVPGLLSWRDFLTRRYFRDQRITTYDVVGGDYPFDKNARMETSSTDDSDSSAQEFAEHLYYWLRNGRNRARVDAVLAMIDEPFRYTANEVYAYEFADDGGIKRSVIDGTRFARSVTADGQVAIMSDTSLQNGASAIIFFRDNVKSLGSDDSQHGGQPLAGYPLHAVEGFIDYRELSADFARRGEHRDGLALDIEIGGTGDSTANADVTSMRTRTRSRKI